MVIGFSFGFLIRNCVIIQTDTMSDWEDDEWNSKPKMAAPAPVRRSVQDNDWDDGPSQTTKRNDRHERSRSSHRDSDGGRSNNNYMDSSDGQGDQVTFAVSKTSVGTIIGRGGSKIKELESRFHVKLNIGELFISFICDFFLLQ